MVFENAGLAHLARASAFQAEGSGFEPRVPLQLLSNNFNHSSAILKQTFFRQKSVWDHFGIHPIFPFPEKAKSLVQLGVTDALDRDGYQRGSELGNCSPVLGCSTPEFP